MDEDFRRLIDTSKFSYIKHNESNFESFHSFQNELDKRYEEIEKERNRKERIANVRKWDSNLSKRWSGASLKSIENKAAAVAAGMIKNDGFGSFFVKGEPSVGKTYLSFAIIRRYIAMGYVTPSQVKVISEENLLMIPKLGFQGSDKFDKLLSSVYKLYLFDNVSTRDSYSKLEGPLWEQLLEHIYSKNLSAIFTSVGSAKNFSEKLSGPASSKFSHLVDGRIIEMTGKNKSAELDDFTNEEKNVIDSEHKDLDLFNRFKGK